MQTPVVILLVGTRAAAGELLSDHLREAGLNVWVAHTAAEVPGCLAHAGANAVLISLAVDCFIDARSLHEGRRCICVGACEMRGDIPSDAHVLHEPIDLDRLQELIHHCGA